MTDTTKDITTYFKNEKLINQIASELADMISQFITNPDIGLLDYVFDVSNGKVKNQDANTFFMFDLAKDCEGYKFIKAMYAENLDEANEAEMQETIKQIGLALQNNHAEIIRTVVRKAVINNADAELVPLSTIEILNIDIVDFDSIEEDERSTLKFMKVPSIPINVPAIMAFLTNYKEKHPEMKRKDIIMHEHLKGNKLFEAILGVEQGDKFLWNISVSAFVDYSFSDTMKPKDTDKD